MATCRKLLFYDTGDIYDYDLTFSSTGIPHVSFRDANNNSGISVMKYENNSWQYVGNQSFVLMKPSNNNTGIEMTSNDLPVVGFNESSCGSDEAQKKSIILYPNPVETNLYLKNNFRPIEYRIINEQNQVVKSGKVLQNIQVEDLATGVYFLKIFDKKKS